MSQEPIIKLYVGWEEELYKAHQIKSKYVVGKFNTLDVTALKRSLSARYKELNKMIACRQAVVLDKPVTSEEDKHGVE